MVVEDFKISKARGVSKSSSDAYSSSHIVERKKLEELGQWIWQEVSK
jgi:hypothetical protein